MNLLNKCDEERYSCIVYIYIWVYGEIQHPLKTRKICSDSKYILLSYKINNGKRDSQFWSYLPFHLSAMNRIEEGRWVTLKSFLLYINFPPGKEREC